MTSELRASWPIGSGSLTSAENASCSIRAAEPDASAAVPSHRSSHASRAPARAAMAALHQRERADALQREADRRLEAGDREAVGDQAIHHLGPRAGGERDAGAEGDHLRALPAGLERVVIEALEDLAGVLVGADIHEREEPRRRDVPLAGQGPLRRRELGRAIEDAQREVVAAGRAMGYCGIVEYT